jgi:cytochrome c peroxidase
LKAAVLLTLAFLPIPLRAAPLHLEFAHEAAGAPLLRDSIRYTNSRDETFSVTRLAWLISGFAFLTEGGETVIRPDFHTFIDTGGGRISIPDLPAAKLKSVTFFVGPDEKLNHADPAGFPANHPLNPNLNRLHWDWQGGYIFLAMEGHWRAPGDKLPAGYAWHFARDPNRTSITLPVDLDLRNETRVTIALDATRIADGLSFARDGATTHSAEGDPVAARIKKNLAGTFRVVAVETGGVPTPPNPPKPIDLPADPQAYPITLPRHIPLPALPPDNPLLAPRVALGEKLFHEPKLSRTNELSCASCHQGGVMSDPRRFSSGVDGGHANRHSMPLFNLAWKGSFFWDGRSPSLRAQALVPIEDHLEMDESLENVVAKLKADPEYTALFAKAFGSGAITPENLGLALENFLLTRLSLDSKLDRSIKGQATLTDEEKRGMELFFTESEPRLGKLGADCFHCHGGALFTDHDFHNNGLSTTDDVGLEKVTGMASDRFKFSTPSLRNVALTAPYMHDGRFATLEEVIDHYNSGFVRNETLDPNLAKHPQGLGLTDADKKALVAFLKALTDPAFE